MFLLGDIIVLAYSVIVLTGWFMFLTNNYVFSSNEQCWISSQFDIASSLSLPRSFPFLFLCIATFPLPLPPPLFWSSDIHFMSPLSEERTFLESTVKGDWIYYLAWNITCTNILHRLRLPFYASLICILSLSFPFSFEPRITDVRLQCFLQMYV